MGVNQKGGTEVAKTPKVKASRVKYWSELRDLRKLRNHVDRTPQDKKSAESLVRRGERPTTVKTKAGVVVKSKKRN